MNKFVHRKSFIRENHIKKYNLKKINNIINRLYTKKSIIERNNKNKIIVNQKTSNKKIVICKNII